MACRADARKAGADDQYVNVIDGLGGRVRLGCILADIWGLLGWSEDVTVAASLSTSC